MTTFKDGPAKGVRLSLARVPIFLRVVRNPAGAIDALDQLDDAPEPDETMFVYLRIGEPSTVHYDGRDAKTGKRFGRWEQYGEYRLFDLQPDDATMRDQQRWTEWATAIHAGLIAP